MLHRVQRLWVLGVLAPILLIGAGLWAFAASAFTITSISPNPFNPKAGQLATIRYSVPTLSNPRIYVTNSSGTEIRSIVSYRGMPAGSYQRTWDGKDRSGAVVPDGTYIVHIAGLSSTGATVGSAMAPVTVRSSETTTPPSSSSSFTITGIAPNPFNPSDGSTTINYTVPVRAKARISVTDSSGATVRSLAYYYSISAGAYQRAWDGKDSRGRIVSDGTYTVTITGTNYSTGATLGAAKSTVTVQSAATPPPVSYSFDISGISPNPFTPGNGETTTISYRVPTTASVNLAVLNSSGTTVRSLASLTNQAAGSKTQVWDGKDNNGSIVAAGTYTVRISGSTSTGAAITAATASVAVQAPTTPPAADGFTITGISPNPFNPSNGQTTISYTVPATARLRIFVSNSSGTEVRSIVNYVGITAGSYKRTWDGKTNNGSLVPAGEYTVHITGTNYATGATIGTAKAPVTVQFSTTTPPPTDPPTTPPPTNTGELGQTVAGVGSANFAWLKYAGYKYAISFVSPKSGSITQMMTYWKSNGGYGGGNKGRFNFELQTNGSGNYPSGTVIGRVTGLTPNAQAVNNGEGAFRIPISATLSAGQIYHLVITNADPSPSTNWSSPNTLMTEVKPWTGGDNRVAYYASGQWRPWSSQDNAFNTSGGNNVNGTHAPTMITWSDGSNTGDPYYSSAISGGAYFYGSTKAGQYIVWNKPTTTVSRIGIVLRKRGSPAPLTYHFEKVGSGDLAKGTIATASQIGSTPGWVYVILSSPVTLTQGQAYRLWFESPSSSSSSCFYTHPVYGDNNPAAWLQCGWGGTQSAYTTSSGSSWSMNQAFDLTFSMQ